MINFLLDFIDKNIFCNFKNYITVKNSVKKLPVNEEFEEMVLLHQSCFEVEY